MDEDIRASLSEIKSDVKDGFREVKKDISELVTKGEFASEVRRIDQQHASLSQQFKDHEIQTAANVAHVKSGDDAVRGELISKIDEFKTSQRWAIGISIPAIGILVGIINFALEHFK